MAGTIQAGGLVKDRLMGQVWAVIELTPNGGATIQRNSICKTVNLCDLELLREPADCSVTKSLVAQTENPLSAN
jgi:hypothetical protein